MNKNPNWHLINKKIDEGMRVKDVAKMFNMNPSTISRKKTVREETMKLSQNELGETLLKRIANAELNVKRQRAIVNQQRKLINNDIRKQSFIDSVIDLIDVKPIKTYDYKTKKDNKKRWDKWILPLGDFHYIGKEDDKYFEGYFSKIYNFIKENKIKELTIIFGGDYIEGSNHHDQISNGYVKVEQMMGITNHIITFIEKVINEIEFSNILVISGNHDRVERVAKNSNYKDTFALVLYDTIKKTFKEYWKSEWNELLYDPIELFWEDNAITSYITHGDSIGNDPQKYIISKENQNKEYGNIDITYLFHSHKFNFEMWKGTDRKVVRVPASKNPKSLNAFEIKNNQKSTTGFIFLRQEVQDNNFDIFFRKT